MENISRKNVPSRRLQVSSFQLPKRLTKDIYAAKQARVKSYYQTSKHFLAMSESHSIGKSCLLISGRLNRFQLPIHLQVLRCLSNAIHTSCTEKNIKADFLTAHFSSSVFHGTEKRCTPQLNQNKTDANEDIFSAI